MAFSTPVFLFCFFPITVGLYFFARHKYRNIVLLVASLVFYAWGEPKTIFLMLLSIIVNYTLARIIENKNDGKRKFYLIISIIYNIGVLFIFKYLGFGIEILESVFGIKLNIRDIALPIGISFYTFQILSYVIDVYRKKVPAQKNILDLGLYISLFPQLIAGPIVRYIDISQEIKNRETKQEDIYYGAKRFIFGFAKKILLADQLARIADLAFSGEWNSALGYWIGMVAYTLQIYYDFSGYSDMAIGIGRLFGFHFLENFNFPYIAKSVQEFWRRWHISLSSWFRDYVYIPMGGNRKGTKRTYLNLLIIFLLTGLWHGASYNFIVWGLFHGTFIILERLFLKKYLEKIPVVFQHIYTLLIVMTGWVFFRADNLNAAIVYLGHLFQPYPLDFAKCLYQLNAEVICVFICSIIFIFPHEWIQKVVTRHLQLPLKSILTDIVAVLLLLLSIMYMMGNGFSPFLYFRF